MSEETETLSSLVKQQAYEAARKYIDFLENREVVPEDEDKAPEES